jgi:hypothetical protein
MTSRFPLFLIPFVIGIVFATAKPVAAQPGQSTARGANDRQLILLSTPSGAAVFIDGAQVGTTPYAGRFAPGIYQVRVSKDRYALWGQRISLRDDQRVLIALRQRRGRMWLWAVTGLAVAGGAAGGAVAILNKKPPTVPPGGDGDNGLPSAPPGHP